ncbi:unnamed protein product [Protopolystoma xenopodis]|uniref:Uncharacterized protein n=1 Tax=Protopolystoma xenopodis TaxID=117903 RepID=A0A448XA68_9PLAT|nr:unnamed protein product [Protopolystoma xenopodis]
MCKHTCYSQHPLNTPTNTHTHTLTGAHKHTLTTSLCVPSLGGAGLQYRIGEIPTSRQSFAPRGRWSVSSCSPFTRAALSSSQDSAKVRPVPSNHCQHHGMELMPIRARV